MQAHERTAKHTQNWARHEADQATSAEAEMLRATAYLAPPVAPVAGISQSSLYTDIPEVLPEEPFTTTSFDATNELDQMLNPSWHSDTLLSAESVQERLRSEVEHLLQVTEENELGLWIEEEDEQLVNQIESELGSSVPNASNGMSIICWVQSCC